MAYMIPSSPEAIRDRLSKQLDTRASKVQRLEKYYIGEHPLPKPKKSLDPRIFDEACRLYRGLTEVGVTNWVKLVADTPSERLAIKGFRFGDEEYRDDKPAWLIWQRNSLDADSTLVHDNAFQTGNSFVLVWPDEDGKATITPEHSGEVILCYEPGSRRKRSAALKRFVDESGALNCTLYLPDALYKWQTRSTRPSYGAAMGDMSWDERYVDGESWPLPNPYGEVPVFEFRANAGLKAAPYGGGIGEFEGVLPIQDRINKTIFDRLVTSEAQAFLQRYTIGWEVPVDPITNQPDGRAVQRASQSQLWTFPEDVSVGEFRQADFAPFIKAVESDVNAMAAISKTPPHYLLGAMINISAEALAAAESGLVAKCMKHQGNFGESWEEVIRFALRVEGDPRADDVQSQIVWRDPQFRSLAEAAAALVQLKGLGIPDRVLWSMVPGVNSQDLDRWAAENAATALLASEPAAPPAPVPNAGF